MRAWALLLPRGEEHDPEVSEVLSREIVHGLRVLGAIAVLVPLPSLLGLLSGLFGPLDPWSSEHLWTSLLLANGVVTLLGCTLLAASRTEIGVRHGRALVTVVTAISAAINVWTLAQHGLGRYGLEVPFYFLLSVVAMPYRPPQAFVSGLVIGASALITRTALVPEASTWQAIGATAFFWLLLQVVGAVISGFSYDSRLRSAEAIVERKRLAEKLSASDVELRETARRLTAYAADLEQKNREIQRAQGQLVQSEKMAAIGSLVAGVAHEINTPLGSIHSNVDVTRRALGVIRTAAADPEISRVLEREPKISRSLDLLEQLNGVSQEASQRIMAIVRSLRSFARLDEAELKEVDLHEGLDSTLTLVAHQMKNRIKAVREYGALPRVFCFPNQLNQVFMNLLTNAIQAIEGPGTITVRTRSEGSEVQIEISDTGKGIAPEHLERIFDPGFTTKGVGVGTGLGLSISYRIVQDHGGSISVRSTPGEGSTFTVHVPIAGPTGSR